MMHAMRGWWHGRHHDGGPFHGASCAPHRHGGGRGRGGWHPGGPDGGGFGVRRPLRFLVHKLELDDKQSAAVAKILDELKTERAQAEVDDRRAVSAFADAIAGESFDENGAASAAKRRTETAERLAAAVQKALGELHALLDSEQREMLAFLIRSGALGL